MSEKKKQTQRGVTLVELLVVIVILGVLSTIVAINVLPAGDTAREQAAKTQVDVFAAALQQYRLDQGSYPGQDDGLLALIEAPQGLRRPEKYRQGGYIDKAQIPADPWGNDYVYQAQGEFGVFDVYSYGPDGRPGGGDDIGNWQ